MLMKWRKIAMAKMVKLTKTQLKAKLDFIKEYMEERNAASSSVFDPNANISQKNIATMSAEIFKDFSIQTNRAIVANRIEEKFGEELAREYIRMIEDHEIYIHDETSLMPYTYGSSEGIVVYKGGEKKLTTFELLYDSYHSLKEKLLEAGVWAKYPQDLYIDDVNGKTKVTRLVKKNRHRDMVRVKTRFGEDLIVTDNHPMIIDKEDIENTVPAISSLGEVQFKKDTPFRSEVLEVSILDTFKNYESYGSYCVSKENNGKKVEGIKSYIKLNDKLGYAVGFFIAEGCYTESGLSFSQGDADILKKVASYIWETTGIVGKIYKDISPTHDGRNIKYSLCYNSSSLKHLFLECFEIPPLAERKALPSNIYQTNKSFVGGLIAGLIDGDGSVGKTISIRVASRALISQLSILLRSFGFGISMSYQEQSDIAFGSFSSNYPIFGISFGHTGDLSFSLSEKVTGQVTNITRYKKEGSTILSVTKIENKSYLDSFIYDITTDSHQFLCNNLQVHNCVSITMYPFLLEGTKTLGGHSDAPKHLESFCGEFLNLIFSIAAQFAGAVSTPEFLMYFDHFARKDLGDDYLETHGDFISDKLQQVIYTLNEPAAARNYQSVFWNIALFDKYYFESMFGGFAFPDGDRPDWESVKTLQKFYLKWINAERSKKLLTFPVTTANILSEEDAPADADFACTICMELAEGNSFFIYMSDTVDSLSSCCRLRNELSDNTFSYTLGAGGVATGSINVITINANRIVQNGVDLASVVDKINKFQVAYRSIIEDYLEANLLTVYSAGFIQLDKQFLTIGINGLAESAEFFGLEVGNNSDYIGYLEGTLKVIYDGNRKAAKKTGFKFNTEMVPGENLGVKNAKWDKKDGLIVNRDCYNSYFYLSEDDQSNMVDKFILHGKECTKYLDGGSALHLNLERYLTSEGYMQLLILMAKTGCNYLGTNTLITLCKEKDCEYINKNTVLKCTQCGSLNVNHATRVIGFLKEIETFSEARQDESGLRFYHKG